METRIQDLENRIEELENLLQVSSSPKGVSDSSIDRFVDELLQDPEINMYLVPDTLESEIYTKVLRSVMKALEKSLANAEVSLFNHSIKFSLKPKMD